MCPCLGRRCRWLINDAEAYVEDYASHQLGWGSFSSIDGFGGHLTHKHSRSGGGEVGGGQMRHACCVYMMDGFDDIDCVKWSFIVCEWRIIFR